MVAIDDLTEIPSDLFDRLVLAAERAEFGQHELVETATGARLVHKQCQRTGPSVFDDSARQRAPLSESREDAPPRSAPLATREGREGQRSGEVWVRRGSIWTRTSGVAPRTCEPVPRRASVGDVVRVTQPRPQLFGASAAKLDCGKTSCGVTVRVPNSMGKVIRICDGYDPLRRASR
eukprot:CAMPEP_0194527198 /NCGR_PEP_ID=MMETSP0253-20130528/63220_1 /TAXON_ID=2966 /ORGANISM="Noctiluca scintillans" /LENGTH=176 /DNA_ID=CAMNT_0039372103 /DNA_START=18 /DNA_END=548 /DNA_ORIENTATION=-